MFRSRNFCILSILVNLVIAATTKIPPSFPLWKEQAKSAVYSRSLGPPTASGVDFMNIPYVPKPLFFPKSVDPKIMIAQKTELLKNIFGGLNPVNYPIIDPSDDSFNFGRTKPFLYATINREESPEDTAKLETTLENDKKKTDYVKRGIFGSKFGSFGSGNSKFFPSLSEVSSGLSYSYPETKSNGFDFSESSSQRKRSIAPMANIPADQASFPPYPEIGPIFEYPGYYNYNTSQPYFSSVFGAFSPYGPFGPTPMIDPVNMFTAKKTAFLNQLFKSFGTSASSPKTDKLTDNPADTVNFWSSLNSPEITTEVPVPKSTIVPPGFWAPSSVIPAPGEYTTKVSIFLDKLFKNIANKTAAKAAAASSAVVSDVSSNVMARSLFNSNNPLDSTIDRVARSTDDMQSLSIAKDAIIDSIITELGSLKTDMLNNFNDFAMAQQLFMASIGKSSSKPFKTAYPGLYKSTTTDFSLPYKQKMVVLSKVFDSLTELQKNISLSMSDAIKANMNEDSDKSDQYSSDGNSGQNNKFNETSADTELNNIMKINPPLAYPDPALFYQPFAPSYQQFPFYQPPAPIQTTEPFWMAFVKAKSVTPKPKKMKGIKRDIENDLENYDLSEDYNDEDGNKKDQYKRAIKMSMKQGFPPETVENIQASGSPDSRHQGGGMNLPNLHNYEDNNQDWNKWSDWADNIHNFYKIHKHKHHH